MTKTAAKYSLLYRSVFGSSLYHVFMVARPDPPKNHCQGLKPFHPNLNRGRWSSVDLVDDQAVGALVLLRNRPHLCGRLQLDFEGWNFKLRISFTFKNPSAAILSCHNEPKDFQNSFTFIREWQHTTDLRWICHRKRSSRRRCSRRASRRRAPASSCPDPELREEEQLSAWDVRFRPTPRWLRS